MKIWKLIFTAPDGTGGGEAYQDRWLAEQKFNEAKASGGLVILAEYHDDTMTEVVRDSRLERVVGVFFHSTGR